MDENHRKFLERQRDHYQETAEGARLTMNGERWQWHLKELVRAETYMRLYTAALDKGVEYAARRAWQIIRDGSDASSSDPMDRGAAQVERVAALEVLAMLAAAGLSHARLGELVATGRLSTAVDSSVSNPAPGVTG